MGHMTQDRTKSDTADKIFESNCKLPPNNP